MQMIEHSIDNLIDTILFRARHGAAQHASRALSLSEKAPGVLV